MENLRKTKRGSKTIRAQNTSDILSKTINNQNRLTQTWLTMSRGPM